MVFSSRENAHRPVPALTGNGELCTTIGRSGFHDSSGDEKLLCTQEFVLAGRRLEGPMHPLISFGQLLAKPPAGEWEQIIDTERGTIDTTYVINGLHVSVKSGVLKHRNCFFAVVRFRNDSDAVRKLDWKLTYEIAQQASLSQAWRIDKGTAVVDWGANDHLGVITMNAACLELALTESGCTFFTTESISAGDTMECSLAIQFSDRVRYQEPFGISELSSQLEQCREEWQAFWSTSHVQTNIKEIDRFRNISLYTIACQATPWSVPPTLSKPYWDGGAFHDEYYPFQALLSCGYVEEARRIPYYRLATLPKAIERARARGALYPWSATEDGRERDPHGHWYTERFHLGQIAACVWDLYTATGEAEELKRLYPVIFETARYFEMNMLTRCQDGHLITEPCTDFDESVGEVDAGMFTMCAAAYLFALHARVAKLLNMDNEWGERLTELSMEIAHGISQGDGAYINASASHQHSSSLGPIVPFGLDCESAVARATLETAFSSLQAKNGWKPGQHPVFDETAWVWTAGHLGMSAARLSMPERAWAALERGTLSSGQFMSPNEHLKGESVVVPWFTTGCGAWLAALGWAFAMRGEPNQLFGGVPQSVRDFEFQGILLSDGVRVSAKVESGGLTELVFQADKPTTLDVSIPYRFFDGISLTGAASVYKEQDRAVITVQLVIGSNNLIK